MVGPALVAGAWLCGADAERDRLPLTGHPRLGASGLSTCVDPAEAAARYDASGSFDGRLQTAHFEIDYDTDSEIASESYLAVLATALERSWQTEVDELGWPAPEGSETYAVQVILGNFPSEMPYGGVASIADCEGQDVGYILLNTDLWYRNTDYLLDVPAHELNHLLQYASGADYGARDSVFFYEATAVWMEERVHGDTDTYALDFLPAYLENPGERLTSYEYATGLQYGHFVWDTYLDQVVGGPDLVRDLWVEAESSVSVLERTEAVLLERGEGGLDLHWAGFLAWMVNFDMEDHDVFVETLESSGADWYAVDTEVPADGESPASPEKLGGAFLHLRAPEGQGLSFSLRGLDEDGWVAGGTDGVTRQVVVAEEGALQLRFDAAEVWVGVGPTGQDAGDWSWSAEAVELEVDDTDSEEGEPNKASASTGCGCTASGRRTASGAWVVLLVLGGWRRAGGSRWTGRALPLTLLLACGSPIDGTLPEGIYGSPELGLRVAASGAATFERSCGRGELGVVKATDGELHANFAWILIGGVPDTDTAADEGTPATVDATVSTARVRGTIESGGQTDEIDLRWGEEPTYFECP